jgi:hypothetical protein
VFGFLLIVPRRIVRLADDIGSMADGVTRMVSLVAVLPSVLEELSRIDERVAHMDREVTEMHSAVEGLRGDIVNLDTALESMTEAVLPLGPAAERLGSLGRWRRTKAAEPPVPPVTERPADGAA